MTDRVYTRNRVSDFGNAMQKVFLKGKLNKAFLHYYLPNFWHVCWFFHVECTEDQLWIIGTRYITTGKWPNFDPDFLSNVEMIFGLVDWTKSRFWFLLWWKISSQRQNCSAAYKKNFFKNPFLNRQNWI